MPLTSLQSQNSGNFKLSAYISAVNGAGLGLGGKYAFHISIKSSLRENDSFTSKYISNTLGYVLNSDSKQTCPINVSMCQLCRHVAIITKLYKWLSFPFYFQNKNFPFKWHLFSILLWLYFCIYSSRCSILFFTKKETIDSCR